mmetsp:Transcript_27402/g.63988  ORF Transcript_27402/g.63988 Transcript_27402/m.63988 type:complete len:737 (+) Transcript_27402:27-2237(+)
MASLVLPSANSGDPDRRQGVNPAPETATLQCAQVPANTLLLRFDGEDDVPGLALDDDVSEQFEYFGRLRADGFSEAAAGVARLPCRRDVFEAFVRIAQQRTQAAALDLPTRLEVLRFADMVSAVDVVQMLVESLRTDYLSEGEGARDSAIITLNELADLLEAGQSSSTPALLASAGTQVAPVTPSSSAAVWLVSASAMTPGLTPVSMSITPPPQASHHRIGLPSNSEPLPPLSRLREYCLEALPNWTRQRCAEQPRLWRLDLPTVLDVYSAEASPRAESSWLAVHAARRLSKDIIPFTSVDNEVAQQLEARHPEICVRRCVTLCVRELPHVKLVAGFGGTQIEIKVSLNSGLGGGWILGVGGQGLCALRKAFLEIEGDEGGEEKLVFTGLNLMENAGATGRQEEAVLGFGSCPKHTPLPFTAKVTLLEYPLHLAVQTYIGLNFNTMASLCPDFDFGPMDLACVMELWLQSDQLRRVPEADIEEIVERTLHYVKLVWAPVVRVSFIVCMHSCWSQASYTWWHASLIKSCLELEVWRSSGGTAADTVNTAANSSLFRPYIVQIMSNALFEHKEVFVLALKNFVDGLPTITVNSIAVFFPEVPDSVSDPIAVVARHYLCLLQGAMKEDAGTSTVPSLKVLAELLTGFRRLVPVLEGSSPRTVVLAFVSLMALCDLRHQRWLCVDSFSVLLALRYGGQNLEPRLQREEQERAMHFWTECFMTFLAFANAAEVSASARQGR